MARSESRRWKALERNRVTAVALHGKDQLRDVLVAQLHAGAGPVVGRGCSRRLGSSAPGSRAYLCRSCNFVEGDRVSAQFFEDRTKWRLGATANMRAVESTSSKVMSIRQAD